MKKTILFICTLILFGSCSSDDQNSEFIIGQWKIDIRFENGNEVELSPCDLVKVQEFRSDFSMGTFNDGETPGVLCGNLPFELYVWEKISEGHYISNHIDVNNLTINYYRENNKLKMVFDNGNEAILSKI